MSRFDKATFMAVTNDVASVYDENEVLKAENEELKKALNTYMEENKNLTELLGRYQMTDTSEDEFPDAFYKKDAKKDEFPYAFVKKDSAKDDKESMDIAIQKLSPHDAAVFIAELLFG